MFDGLSIAGIRSKRCQFFVQISPSLNDSCSVLLRGHGLVSKPGPAALFCVFFPYVRVVHWPNCVRRALLATNADKKFRYSFKLYVILM